MLFGFVASAEHPAEVTDVPGDRADVVGTGEPEVVCEGHQTRVEVGGNIDLSQHERGLRPERHREKPDDIVVRGEPRSRIQFEQGQRLVTLADLGDLWVTANFKESTLKQMHAGQSVTISVDAFDQDFDGTVEAMPGSTGSVTSLLPPENATGNYVKVVQRLPVRIRFKPGQQGLDRLRPGMSVVPKIWLK